MVATGTINKMWVFRINVLLKLFLTWEYSQFKQTWGSAASNEPLNTFCSQGSETPLRPQRDRYSWLLEQLLQPLHSVSAPLVRAGCGIYCSQEFTGRRTAIIQGWVLGRTCGVHRRTLQSCGCWTQSFIWWRSWRSGWVSELRVSGSFRCSCTTWLPWRRRWTNLRPVQD